MKNQHVIFWEEPNRGNALTLHIGPSGKRCTTITGISWIDEHRFIAVHRAGCRMALFDLREGDKPLLIAKIPHLSDAVATKKLNENTWEVVHCGCWDTLYSTFRLILDDNPRFTYHGMTFTSLRNRFRRLINKKRAEFSFSHGIEYDKDGKICLSISCGKTPRIHIGDKISYLPKPFGSRDICIDPKTGTYYTVAVSEVPKPVAYTNTETHAYKYLPDTNEWQVIAKFPQVHSDACYVYNDRLWMTDQLSDRVIGVDIHEKQDPIFITDDSLDFPHGLEVSPKGLLAVTNYGNSSLSFFDLNEVA